MDFTALDKEYLIPFYGRSPLVFVRGKDHWLFDSKGRKFLDLAAGISVVNFGHANAKIAKAVSRQMRTISHVSNLYTIPAQAELVKRLTEKAFKGKAFFCNSGAEANEAALKMARLFGIQKSPDKNKVLALKGSFHGRTIATITLTGQDKYKKGFEPLLGNIDFVEPGNSADLESKMNGNVCAIFLEAVQGEGGVKMLPADFVEKAAALAKQHGALLIFDEVQAGLGRTGKYFGYQNFKVQPDIITLAKALGNGFPMGLTLVKPEIADAMPAGMHASTFGGNYAACAAGLAVMDILNDSLLSHINELSRYLQVKLEAIRAEYPAKIIENCAPIRLQREG